MNLKERRAEFEKSKTVCASAKLTFRGVDGYDVYNTSTPFEWQGRIVIANPFTACEEGTQTKGERQHVQRYVRNHPPE